MADVFVYLVDLPVSVSEMVTPCLDGYCVYLNSRLSQSSMEEAYKHALYHIEHNDWEKDDVQLIEAEAHKGVTS